METSIYTKALCEGWFRIEKMKSDGNGSPIASTRTVVADWFPNLITDSGLDLLAVTKYLRACHVGSGSDSPAISDARLKNWIGSTDTRFNQVSDTNEKEGYGYTRITYRFEVGSAVGNISELGIADDYSKDKYTLFSRALVLDQDGKPTSITILPDEVLDVTYELRLYIPTVDNSGDITLSGSNATHHWTSRAIYCKGGQSPWSYMLGFPFSHTESNLFSFGIVAHSQVKLLDLSSSIPPSGSLHFTSAASKPYTSGTHEIAYDFFADIDSCNFNEGIGWIAVTTTLGAYQWMLDPPIKKNTTNKLKITMRFAWSRRS